MSSKIILIFFSTFLCGICELVESRPPRLDIFHQLLPNADVGNGTGTLSVDRLEKYIHGLLDQLSCSCATENNTQEITDNCNQTMCFNTSQLVAVVDGDSEAGINEEQLRNVSLILLFYIAQVDDVCRRTVTLGNNTVETAYEYLRNRTSDSGGVQAILDSIKPHLSHDHDAHGKRRRRSLEDQHTSRHHQRHTRALNDVTENHPVSISYLVIEEKCLSSDAVQYYLRSEGNEASFDIGQFATLVVYLLYSGYQIEPKCRLLPSKDAFIDNLFLHFGDGLMISPDGFDTLMENLAIEPVSQESTHVHATERKRRETRQKDAHAGRVKRQVHSDITECYSAQQLLALYDSSAGLDKTHFQELSPALVSQKLYGDCAAKSQSSSVTDAEKYGYGSVAIFIICLCSIFGVVFVPCSSRKVYDVIMALFLGLAVGTLFADAILHLIPQTMGIHDHGAEGHAHDEEGIVVEDYVTFGLAIMAGLYFFYLLELVMSKLGGHSHSHDETTDEKVDHITSNGEIHKDKEENVTQAQKGLTPLAVMIILGDAVHNLADGLAIGAAFSGSVSVGVSTSIAVFCHELPHELGDFAVLLKSGMGFKKALLLNFISALTAFIGLYVGIAASSNDVARSWIFAVTAGMFLYIALVDLLPLLIHSKSLLALVLNNLGILLGFAIMLIIAIFEEHIKI